MLAWSEFVFFNEGPADALIATLAQGVLPPAFFLGEMVVFYVVPSAFLVGLVGLFGSHGLGRIMLLGALTGYSIEGAVVPAVYETVPFSYLWTSIAWHGPVTVGLGVFLLPRLLAEASTARMITVSVILGGVWAVWTTWTWGHGGTTVPSVEFFLYAAVTAALFVLGYGLCFAAGWPRIAIPRWVSLVLCLPTLLLFLVQGVNVPTYAAGLLLIVAALMSVLYVWGRDIDSGYRIKSGNVAILVVMPIVAGLVHTILLQTGAPIETEDMVSLVFLIGLVAWVYGIMREVRLRLRT